MATAISRRTVLGGTALMLAAACGRSKSSGGGSSTLTFLEPGDEPVGWSSVLQAVNKKLHKDKGLTLKIQWIGWSNYSETELLKFTSGEHFAGADEATWLHITKLAQDKAIDPVERKLASDKYPNLAKTINPKTIRANTFDGHLWGIPQVNNASIELGFVIRSDLAAKYGIPDVESYDDFEKFLYAVKQHESSMIPYGMDNGYVNNAIALFNADGWRRQSPYLSVGLPSGGTVAYAKLSDIQAGHASVIPLWEVPELVDTLKRIRRYYTDGILNHDQLNVDKNTIYSLFGQGKYAAAISATDGLTTTTYGATTKNVKGAAIELVLPRGRNNTTKPFSAFSATNNVAINHTSNQLDEVFALEDWLSVKENHDLLEYGVEGKDWKAADDRTYTPISKYVFPGYTLSWRVPLERNPSDMIDSEKRWFDWSKDFNNFQLSPTAGFNLNQQPIKTQLAQLGAAYTKFVLPLFAGMVDTNKGISAMKAGYDKAGIDKALAETEKQLNAFLKTHH